MLGGGGGGEGVALQINLSLVSCSAISGDGLNLHEPHFPPSPKDRWDCLNID